MRVHFIEILKKARRQIRLTSQGMQCVEHPRDVDPIAFRLRGVGKLRYEYLKAGNYSCCEMLFSTLDEFLALRSIGQLGWQYQMVEQVLKLQALVCHCVCKSLWTLVKRYL